jgi:hypothetical protein
MLTALKILVYTYHKNNFQSFIVKSKVMREGGVREGGMREGGVYLNIRNNGNVTSYFTNSQISDYRFLPEFL